MIKKNPHKTEKTAQEELKERLVDISFSDAIKTDKELPSLEELIQTAKKVKETFKDENTPRPQANF